MKKFFLFIFAFCIFLIFLSGIFFYEVKTPENMDEVANNETVSEPIAELPREDIKAVVPEEKLAVRFVDSAVPFVAQAPDGDWKNPRYQDGCEEASMLMAVRWVEGEKIMNPKKELDEISRAMEKKLGTFHDTSTMDAFTFVKSKLQTGREFIKENVAVTDMIDAIENKNILVVATNGQKLKNPNFTVPGPQYRMLLVRGYDPKTGEFITNDPGTRKGEGYRYKTKILFEAMQTYKTGYHGKTFPQEKTMIVFGRM